MNHLKQIAARLGDYDIQAMLVTSAPGEAYAVAFHGEGVVLAAGSDPYYVTDTRYIEAAQEQITGCRIGCIRPGWDHKTLVAQEIAARGITRVGIQEESMTLAQYRGWKKALGDGVELVPAGELILDLRARKDGEELACMRAAQEVTDRAFAEILNDIRPGVTEREIAARLTYLQMKFGGEGNSFDPIVASGPNGSRPHAVPGGRQIQAGDFVTLDFGALVGGYCSDMTRTVAVGQPTEEMARVYDIVLQAQLTGIAQARGGLVGREVDAAARAVIEAAGYGHDFGHSLGHSLGLEIHESPNFSPKEENVVPVGAVVSVEPGIYLPGKFGVRIEDVVWLTEEGCQVLTRSPKELIRL